MLKELLDSLMNEDDSNPMSGLAGNMLKMQLLSGDPQAKVGVPVQILSLDTICETSQFEIIDSKTVLTVKSLDDGKEYKTLLPMGFAEMRDLKVGEYRMASILRIEAERTQTNRITGDSKTSDIEGWDIALLDFTMTEAEATEHLQSYIDRRAAEEQANKILDE